MMISEMTGLPIARSLATLFAVGLACGATGCNREPTAEEQLARGREIVQRMSDKLAGASSFSVTAQEKRDVTRASGKRTQAAVTRKTVVRRPDRFYSEGTGDLHNEVWYDGVGVTLVIHKDKVFAQARMPETIDRTLDSIAERYGVALPQADFLYSSPAKALLTDTTTGGWKGTEDIDGARYDHVAFETKGVSWQLWVPTTGDPLPRRLTADFKQKRQEGHFDITFTEWNLAPTIAADRFDPHVPSDYEGIAMIQRAAVLENIPKEEAPAAK
jgi:hypothetical protein